MRTRADRGSSRLRQNGCVGGAASGSRWTYTEKRRARATVAGELFLVSHDHWSELNEKLHGEVRALGDDKEKGDEVVLGDDLV